MKTCNCFKCCAWRAWAMSKPGIVLFTNIKWNNPYAHTGRERE